MSTPGTGPPRRRAIPFVIVSALTVLALGAAVVSLAAGPSPDQIALQVAAQQTAAVGNFAFTYSLTLGPPPRLHVRSSSVHGSGLWQSPDRWRATSVHAGASSTTTGRGSTMSVPGPDGHPLTTRLPSDALASFSNPNDPVLLLPPLGLLYAATDVVRHGDTYHFDVRRLTLASGWVAYAPLSGATLRLPTLAAFNVQVDVVVTDGRVTRLAFPRGIHTARVGETELAAWHIAGFKTTTLTG
jgi:hypothetical protein